jgi:hypothetical protein
VKEFALPPNPAGEGDKSNLILAMHPHPSFSNERHEVFASRKIRGGRAPEGANELAASSDAARAERSALAFRRPTAALASAMCRGSIQAALHAMQCAGVTCALGVALKRGTSRAGRNAGGVDARTARERQ